ncbi:MAG: polysaccharide biosynthesis tyrosine autokinase [Chloroflexi bacterium]|nr:polysaccharide biosynthesis tyrosine autokinase [Chloroflexota bacterium]
MVNLNGAIEALVRLWWLVLTVGGMAGLLTYHAIRQVPPTFVASTTLMVGDVLRSPKPGENEFSVAQNLATGYAQIAQRQPILDGAVRSLGLQTTWEDLRQRIVVIHPNGALTIEIRAMDTNPVRARDIAASIADQLVEASPTRARKQELDQRQQFLRDELATLQTKIEQGRAELAKKQAALGQETTARGVLDRQDEIKAIELNLSTWRNNYNDVLGALEGRSDPNSLSIIEPAAIPTSPAGPRTTWFVALAAAAGVLVVSSGIVAAEMFGRRVRSGDDIRGAMRSALDGLVAYIPRLGASDTAVAVLTEPDSLAAEAYRLLAAQLRFGVLGNGSHILLVTSATNGEGKSTTAANLASALALGGSNVILIDLDLRKPVLHSLFGLPNREGASAMMREANYDIDRYAVHTALPRLRLIPAGTPVGNPTEILSRSAEALVLAAWSNADYVIVDGPPLLAVADAAVLTGSVPDTLFVARYERTNGRDLRAALDILNGLPTRLRAVVLNAVPWEQLNLYGYYFVPQQRGFMAGLRSMGAWGAGRMPALPGSARGSTSDTAVPKQHGP